MDAGVFATVLFAIAQVRQTRSDSNWILGEVNGTYAVLCATQQRTRTYAAANHAPNPECRAHETLLIQLQSENMMI